MSADKQLLTVRKAATVNDRALRQELRQAYLVAQQVWGYQDDEERELWITSANDGDHMTGSLHYKNRALDIVWQGMAGEPQMRGTYVEALAWYLGEDFDVVDEEDHIHLEHDPK